MNEQTRSTSSRTVTGAVWLIGSRLGTRAIDFVGLLVLARLLTPADFGIIAIGMTLVQLVEAALELPVTQVLVRISAINHALLSTAFTISLIRGFALAILLAIISLPFSLIYHDERLTGLICFLSLAPALRGILSPRLVVFARNIDFRRDVALELVSKSAALLIAAVAAYYTHSYWSIAAGTVCGPVIMSLGSFVLAPFRPAITLAEWPKFASFLGWNSASQIITAINWQCDRPILGLFVNPMQLGTFSLANDLSLLPEQALVKPIFRPLISGFSHIQTDERRLQQAYLKSASLVLATGTPVMIILSLLAYPAIHLTLGNQWQSAAPIVQWLALTLIIPLFSAPTGPLAISLGKSYVFFRQSLLEIMIRIPVTVVLTWKFGIPGLIVSRLITSMLNTATSIYYVKAMIRLGIWRQLAIGWKPMLSGIVLAVFLLNFRPILHGMEGVPLGAATATLALLALLTYLMVSVFLWFCSGRPPGLEQAASEWISAKWQNQRNRSFSL